MFAGKTILAVFFCVLVRSARLIASSQSSILLVESRVVCQIPILVAWIHDFSGLQSHISSEFLIHLEPHFVLLLELHPLLEHFFPPKAEAELHLLGAKRGV